MKAIKKPIPVEFVKLEKTPQSVIEVYRFINGPESVKLTCKAANDAWDNYSDDLINKGYMPLKTLESGEGTQNANFGDYILKGIDGECWPVKHDIFERTYDVQAPLSNETKAVESVTLIQEENKQCSHESLERITTTDGKYYEICHHCSLSFPKHPIIQDESAGRFLLKNRLNDICVSGLAAEPKIFASEAMRMYASQFKNTDAVKVITDRIEKLENNLAFRTHGWLGNKLKYQLQEAKDILKLIQP